MTSGEERGSCPAPLTPGEARALPLAVLGDLCDALGENDFLLEPNGDFGDAFGEDDGLAFGLAFESLGLACFVEGLPFGLAGNLFPDGLLLALPVFGLLPVQLDLAPPGVGEPAGDAALPGPNFALRLAPNLADGRPAPNFADALDPPEDILALYFTDVRSVMLTFVIVEVM